MCIELSELHKGAGKFGALSTEELSEQVSPSKACNIARLSVKFSELPAILQGD